MAIRAVVFDVGGVLCRTPRTNWELAWAKTLGLGPQDLLVALADATRGGSTGAKDLSEIEREISRAFGITAMTVSALMADIWAEYLGSPNNQMIELLVSLRGDYKTAILSNSFVGARERERAAYGFESLCDALIYSHEAGFLKPDPEIYRLTHRTLEVLPHEVLFVDDVEENVAAARSEGWSAIHFVNEPRAVAHIVTRLQEDE